MDAQMTKLDKNNTFFRYRSDVSPYFIPDRRLIVWPRHRFDNRLDTMLSVTWKLTSRPTHLWSRDSIINNTVKVKITHFIFTVLLWCYCKCFHDKRLTSCEITSMATLSGKFPFFSLRKMNSTPDRNTSEEVMQKRTKGYCILKVLINGGSYNITYQGTIISFEHRFIIYYLLNIPYICVFHHIFWTVVRLWFVYVWLFIDLIYGTLTNEMRF